MKSVDIAKCSQLVGRLPREIELPSRSEVDLWAPDAPSFELCEEFGCDVRVTGPEITPLTWIAMEIEQSDLPTRGPPDELPSRRTHAIQSLTGGRNGPAVSAKKLLIGFWRGVRRMHFVRVKEGEDWPIVCKKRLQMFDELLSSPLNGWSEVDVHVKPA